MAPISSASARPAVSSMSVRTSLAPSRASTRAVAAPMPDAAPVMMPTLPSNRAIVSSVLGSRRLCACVSPDQSTREIARVERPQIAGFFSDTDGVNGQAERLGQGDYDATAGAAVQLGDDEAGNSHHLLEHFYLLH